MNKYLFIKYIKKIGYKSNTINNENINDYYQEILIELLFLYSFPSSTLYNLDKKWISISILLELIYFIFLYIDRYLLLEPLNKAVWNWDYNSVSLLLTSDLLLESTIKNKLLDKAKYLNYEEIYKLLYCYKSWIIFFENLYRIDVVNNLNSILKKWLLSRNKAEEFWFINNSFDHIQKRREENFKEIHDYVPIFFSKYSPMIVSSMENSIYLQWKIIFIINSNVLKEENVLFSDISFAIKWASKEKNLFSNLKDLNKINYSLINKKGYINNDIFNKYKWVEVLVKNKLDISYIKEIIYFDENKKEEIESILKENGFNIPITYNNYEDYK